MSIADVATYLLRLADVLDVDLGAVVLAKVQRNEDRDALATARGSALKYEQLTTEAE